MKKFIFGLFILLACQSLLAELPLSTSGGDGFYYYSLGGGRPVPEAATSIPSIRVAGSVRAGMGYTCGEFNPYLNVSQMMNEIEEALRRLPQQFIAGAQAYVINLPGYLLNKANPTLYNTIMKGFDDSFELFNMSFKSCEQIQREIASGENPYEGWISSGKADKWQTETEQNGNDQTIDQTEEAVNQSVANDGVTTTGGQKEGGQNQPPIRVNRAVTLAGYNLMLNRPVNSDAPGPVPGGGNLPEPMVQAWPTPQHAIDWLTDVVGEMEMDISENGNITAVAGKGLKPKVDKVTEEVRGALIEAMNNNNYDEIRKYGNIMQIGLPVIQAIKGESRFVRSIQIDRLATEIALNQIQDQVGMMKQILRAGMMEPNVQKSNSADEINDQIRTKTLPDLEAAVDEMHKELDLRLKTASRTALSIVRKAEGSAKHIYSPVPPSPVENPILDGAVKP